MIKRLAFTAAIFFAIPVAAQAPRPLELGIDAGITIGIGDNSTTEIDIPAQAFRVGFPITPRSSIEPKLRLNIISGNGSSTSYRAELGWLYHFGSARYPGAYQRAGAYVRPFAGLVGESDGDTSTSGLLGAGLGYKMPMISRLSSRFEVNFAHLFGDAEGNQLGLLAGLSFFTR